MWLVAVTLDSSDLDNCMELEKESYIQQRFFCLPLQIQWSVKS